jgi:PKHD-type hydroxylase
MMLQVPEVLSQGELAEVRRLVDAADWGDGNATSGFGAALAKRNRQLPQTGEAAVQAGRIILDALDRNLLFTAAALPRTVLPPLFNRYGPGERFGDHVDNAIRRAPGGGRLRTDLSATLFLTDPDDYDGGELWVDDLYGAHSVKLNAGDLILYPASSVHRVDEVTRGERVSAFFWIQSLIRSDAQRALLLDMDLNIQRLAQRVGQDAPEIVSLTGAYHNLLRMWSEL